MNAVIGGYSTMSEKLLKYLCRFLVVTMLFLTTGCLQFEDKPPSSRDVQKIFERDRETLLFLKDYFISTGYSDLYIYSSCETALAGLEKIVVDDNRAVESFKQLRRKGYEIFDKNDNTIVFEIWSGIRDVSAGIAYSVDGEPISIEYMTEYTPLSENDWYYYVTDYNKARIKD